MVVETASGLTGRYGHQHTVDGRLKQHAQKTYVIVLRWFMCFFRNIHVSLG